MLAVQQPPRMGSTQPESDPLLPFGYSVDQAQEPLFDAPPDPAPGAPLLSESDSKFLSSFFEDMTANQYNMPSFGEGLNFSDAWLDLPPQFMGTATSYGPHSAAPLDPSVEHCYPGPSSGAQPDRSLDLQRMMPGSHLMPPPPPPPLPPSQPQTFHQQHSDDVLNAAATLLQNGSGPRVGAPKISDPSLSRRSIGYSVGHLRHQPLEEFREENRRSSTGTEHDNTFTDWVWGPKGHAPNRKTPSGDLQWGSDSSFGPPQGFAPGIDKESFEVAQQGRGKYFECLDISRNANAFGSSSPADGHPTLDRDRPTTYKREDDPAAPPRKRRKSANVREVAEDDDDNDDNDDDNDDATSARSGWKRKSKAERTGSSPPADATANGRRRKSTVNGTKAPRENLSEEQKRENHIRSEQKRRTLIKEGFDDLGELVPGLKGGGFSKSITLSMAAEWLEDLIRGNKSLSAQLAALDGK